MSTNLVAGLINIETTLKIPGFPLAYEPVRFPFYGVNTSVSGVGYNVMKALTTLGDDVRFLALIGGDSVEAVIRAELGALGVDDSGVRSDLETTPQSIILYDPEGRRAINVDLKDIQDRAYPIDVARAHLHHADLAVLCNINFARPLLAEATALGVPIATDVHTIGDLEDDYNSDFMAAATILFQSDEALPMPPEAWIRALWKRYQTPIVVVGAGADGAYLGVRDDDTIVHVPAVTLVPVVNTIGAGDALFSAFVHAYSRHADPYRALRTAVVFAAVKIGTTGAADGFITSDELAQWCATVTDIV